VDTPPEENNTNSTPVPGSENINDQEPEITQNSDESSASFESHGHSGDDVTNQDSEEDLISSDDIDSGSMHSSEEPMNGGTNESDESDDFPEINEPTSNHLNGNGDVAQFRQTLANLSQQLEIDRLTFLHKKMESQGTKLPSLNEIASDITGDKLLSEEGDCDLFSQRPKARMAGWISGLSFGVNKRAKKFSK
jgi:hypothetical protein